LASVSIPETPHLQRALQGEPALSVAATIATPPEQRAALSLRGIAWPLGLSLCAIGISIWLTYEPGAFGTIRTSLRPGFLLLAALAICGQVAMAGVRIRYVSRGKLTYRNAVRAELTWEFMSGITPSAIGGAPGTGLFVARDNRLSIGEATAMMLYLMLADQAWFVVVVPTILFAATLVPVFPESVGAIGAGTITLYLVGLMAWAGFFAYATLFRPQVLTAVAHWVVRLRPLRRFETRVDAELVRLKRQSRVLRGRSPVYFVGAVALSACVWMCRYLVVLFVALSVAPGLNAVQVLLRAASIWLSALVLPTPGGAGGMEGLFVLFMGPLLPAGFVGPALLTWRLMAYYVLVAIGFGVAGSTFRDIIRRKSRADATGDAATPAAT
jgi:uncharacterized protein (TIRG00374 family)